MEFTTWYEKVTKAYTNDADALDLIQKAVVSMADYVREVCFFETRMSVLSDTKQYSGEELRSEKERIDQKRHDAHESAISGVKLLNRLAEMKGLDPIFCGDITNRYEIADFCGKCVAEIFEKRTR